MTLTCSSRVWLSLSPQQQHTYPWQATIFPHPSDSCLSHEYSSLFSVSLVPWYDLKSSAHRSICRSNSRLVVVVVREVRWTHCMDHGQLSFDPPDGTATQKRNQEPLKGPSTSISQYLLCQSFPGIGCLATPGKQFAGSAGPKGSCFEPRNNNLARGICPVCPMLKMALDPKPFFFYIFNCQELFLHSVVGREPRTVGVQFFFCPQKAAIGRGV